MHLEEWQKLIEKIYYEKDKKRGLAWSYAWIVEEIGELGAELRKLDLQEEDKSTTMAHLHEEFADCLAWLSTLASIAGIKLEDVKERYENGCPYCHTVPCSCKPNK
jgi:NTP pyrophosphatase (non-canonical NTP hydrolase)